MFNSFRYDILITYNFYKILIKKKTTKKKEKQAFPLPTIKGSSTDCLIKYAEQFILIPKAYGLK